MMLRMLLCFAGLATTAFIYLWVYSTTEPYVFLTLEQLLLDPYEGAAKQLDHGAFLIRKWSLVAAAAITAFITCALQRRPGSAFLSGVLVGMLSLLPRLTPWVLSAEGLLAISIFGVGLLVVAVLAVMIDRWLPATAAPLSGLMLLLSIHLAVQSAAAVTLRSNPPLQVLAWLAAGDQSASAQLAGGMHYLSIGGQEQALPHLIAAGKALEGRFEDPAQAELRNAAERLAALSAPESK